MAITFVNDLRLSEMGTGDNSGTWGNVTNTNLELIGQALGHGTRAIANASTDNITMSDGTLDDDRALYLKLTGGGQACTVTLLPATMSKVWIMENGTAAALTFTQGSGANVVIPAGDTKVIACTGGSGTAQIVYDVFTDLNLAGTTVVDDLTVSDTALVTGVLTTTAATVSNGGGQFNGAINVGVDDTGYDVKFFGDTASAFMLWDASADDLILGGAAGLSVNSAALVTGVLTTTAATVFNGGFVSNGASTIAGTTPTLTIGDAGAEDAKIVFDGNAVNFHIGNDDSADTLKIGTGTALGTTPRLSISTGAVIVNELGVDVNTSIRSNGNDNMIFVDGGENTVTIGSATSNASHPFLVEYSATSKFMLGGTSGGITNNIFFNGSAFESINNSVGGAMIQIGTDQTFAFRRGTAASTPTVSYSMYIDASGNVQIGGVSPNSALTVGTSDSTAVITPGGGNTHVTLAGMGSSGTVILGAGASNGSVGAARMTIEVNGDATIEDGDLVIGTGGHGISFAAGAGAGSGTSSDNRLDEYEEGTFTVGVTGGTTVRTNATAVYTRIGDLVTFSYYSLSSNLSNASGAMTITGLPFTATALNSDDVPCSVANNTFFGGSATVGQDAFVGKNGTILYFMNVGTTAQATLVNGNGKFLGVSGSYFAA